MRKTAKALKSAAVDRPQKILAATIAKKNALIRAKTRATVARTCGTLTSRSAVAHSPVPAANEGTLPAGPAAVPDSSTASPIANTRNPPATRSCPFRKYFRASNAVAITKPTESIAHNTGCRSG